MPSPHRPTRKMKKPARMTKPLPSDDRKRSTLNDYKVLLQCIPHGNEWRPEHLRRTFEYIFSEEHEPLVSFPARIREHSRFRFTSRKIRSGGVFTARGSWLLNGLTLLDGDPDIVAIAAYPVVLRYIAATPDKKNTEWKDHIPAVAVLRRNGTVAFVDYKHDLDAQKCEQRTQELALSLSKDCGASYQMIRASETLRQPLFYNRNLIHANRPRWGEVDLSMMERSILEQPLPMTVERLSEALPYNALLERWDDEARESAQPVAGVHVVSSSCLRLAYMGKVELDLSRPFGPSTTVSRRV